MREIEEGMDSAEISEWRVYLADHPLPNHWEIGAQIAMVIYNTSMGCKRPRKIEHFLPQALQAAARDRGFCSAESFRAITRNTDRSGL